MRRLALTLFAKIGETAFAVLVAAQTGGPLPASIAEELSPVSSGPPVWGVVGLTSYPSGKHEAP